MPFTPQYTYPVDSSGNIGYTSGPLLSEETYSCGDSGLINIPGAVINLSAGVWLVEAQLYITTGNHVTTLNWSLSDESGVMDDSRTNFLYLSSSTSGTINVSSHMTSIFSVSDSTIIYMVILFPSSSAQNGSKTYMTYTRLA
jgi:hypothetical protein